MMMKTTTMMMMMMTMMMCKQLKTEKENVVIGIVLVELQFAFCVECKCWLDCESKICFDDTEPWNLQVIWSFNKRITEHNSFFGGRCSNRS
jgi:hypothetical protein